MVKVVGAVFVLVVALALAKVVAVANAVAVTMGSSNAIDVFHFFLHCFPSFLHQLINALKKIGDANEVQKDRDRVKVVHDFLRFLQVNGDVGPTDGREVVERVVKRMALSAVRWRWWWWNLF
jgi:hypothetical protein